MQIKALESAIEKFKFQTRIAKKELNWNLASAKRKNDASHKNCHAAVSSFTARSPAKKVNHEMAPERFSPGGGVGDDAMDLIVDAVRAVKIVEALRIVGREKAKRFELRIKLFERARPETQPIEGQSLGDSPRDKHADIAEAKTILVTARRQAEEIRRR
jgi:hypothetical protein